MALSADREFQRKRNAFYRWQREFLEECARLNTVWGPSDREQVIAKAVEEMQDLIADEERALRQQQIQLKVLFALKVARSGLTLAGSGGGPITLALAGAFVTVGSFVAEKLLPPGRTSPCPRPSSSARGATFSGRRRKS